ncbi:MAG: phosphotransferase [Acidimicrobiia bacterium]|nr:phosphotransferase [Acidimicrobiia bacterium]
MRVTPAAMVGRAVLDRAGQRSDVAVKLLRTPADRRFAFREVEFLSSGVQDLLDLVPHLFYGGAVDTGRDEPPPIVLVTAWVEGSASAESAAESGTSGFDSRWRLAQLQSMLAALPLLDAGAESPLSSLLERRPQSTPITSAVRAMRALRTELLDPSSTPSSPALTRDLGRCVRSLQVIPPPLEPKLCHGDYLLDNVIFNGESIAAVLDWETWNIGDPRFDLGYAIAGVEHTYLATEGTAAEEAHLDLIEEVALTAVDPGARLDERWEWFVALGLARRLWALARGLGQSPAEVRTRQVLNERVELLRHSPAEEVQRDIAGAVDLLDSLRLPFSALGIGPGPDQLLDTGQPGSAERQYFCDRLAAGIASTRLFPRPQLSTDAVERLEMVVRRISTLLRAAE